MTTILLETAFQQGDEAAFTEVHGLYRDSVRARISKVAPPQLQSEIDDICQHFWVSVYKSARSYNPDHPLTTWILSAAGKAVSNYYRTYARKKTVNLMGTINPDDTDCQPLGLGEESYPDYRENPDAQTGLQDEVEEALNRIPREFSKALRAIYLGGKSTSEYARENGIAKQTVYTRVSRGLEHLRRLLGVTE